MVRLTAKIDSTVLQRKSERFEAELRRQNQPTPAQAKKGTPSHDDLEKKMREVFEPVRPGFFDFVKPRLKEDMAFLTSKKVGRYRIHWPNMSADLGEMEKFAGERAMLGPNAPHGEPQPFEATNWDEPYRMVVPQDSFDALLDRQKRRMPLSLVVDAAWWKLLGLAIFAVATPYGLFPAVREAVGGAAATAQAELRKGIALAAKKAGFD